MKIRTWCTAYEMEDGSLWLDTHAEQHTAKRTIESYKEQGFTNIWGPWKEDIENYSLVFGAEDAL